jgi:hypothetical protein
VAAVNYFEMDAAECRHGAERTSDARRPVAIDEAALLRYRGEPAHESVTVPKLNVAAVSELFGRFNGGGIIRVIVQEFGSNGIENPVADVGAIIWHGYAPF